MGLWVVPLLSLVGALVGGGCSLLGTWMAHRYQAMRDEKRRAADDSQRLTRELKEAYAEWFGSVQRMITGLGVADTLRQFGDDPGAANAALSAAVSETTAMGYRVRLLEPNIEARKRTVEILNATSLLLAQLATSDSKDLVARATHSATAMAKLAEVEMWLVDVRFV